MNNSLLEEQEQILLVEYLEIKGLKFTAIPNSTYTKSWNQKRKNKAMGLRKGLPDLLICVKNRLLFVELKRTKGGVTSKEQKEWIEELNGIGNQVIAKICKGADEAIKFIENNLK